MGFTRVRMHFNRILLGKTTRKKASWELPLKHLLIIEGILRTFSGREVY